MVASRNGTVAFVGELLMQFRLDVGRQFEFRDFAGQIVHMLSFANEGSDRKGTDADQDVVSDGERTGIAYRKRPVYSGARKMPNVFFGAGMGGEGMGTGRRWARRAIAALLP